VPDTSQLNSKPAPTSPDAFDRAIAMSHQIAEAEASLARLIDSVVDEDLTKSAETLRVGVDPQREGEPPDDAPCP
jgi:hypothetical protein